MLWSEDEAEAAITLSGEPSVGFLGHMRRVIIEKLIVVSEAAVPVTL